MVTAYSPAGLAKVLSCSGTFTSSAFTAARQVPSGLETQRGITRRDAVDGAVQVGVVPFHFGGNDGVRRCAKRQQQ